MNKVYLDITIGEEKIGRIVCQLFTDEAPKSCENFLHLCKGDISVGDKVLTLKGNHFHRVIKNFMIQAGDLIYGSTEPINREEIGKGGCSIYTTEEELKNSAQQQIQCFGNFEDENLGEFNESFTLAMANTGSKDSNSSQFFITTYPSPHLNGKHSKFGKILHGKSVVRTIERTKVDENGVPILPVVISGCGEWNDEMPVPVYNCCNDTIGNDFYEENPEDDSHFDGEDFAKAFEASDTIKESGTLLFKKRDFQNALFKYKKALNYVNEFIPEPDVNKEYHDKFLSQKRKLYLNISLMLFYLKQYEESIKHTSYLLETDGTSTKEKAKSYLRRGNCFYALNRLETALDDYKKSKELNSEDTILDEKIEITSGKIEAEKERTKKNISKFFQ